MEPIYIYLSDNKRLAIEYVNNNSGYERYFIGIDYKSTSNEKWTVSSNNVLSFHSIKELNQFVDGISKLKKLLILI